MLLPWKMNKVNLSPPFFNLRDAALVIGFFIISQLTGCSSGPNEVAKFYIESELKGNDENARTLVVSGQQEEYTNAGTVMKILFSKMKEGKTRPPEVDTVVRIIAASLVLKIIEQSPEKIVYEYSFDTNAVRKGLDKKDISNQSLLDTTIREAFLNELKKFHHPLVLVKEKNKWKVDYRASK